MRTIILRQQLLLRANTVRLEAFFFSLDLVSNETDEQDVEELIMRNQLRALLKYYIIVLLFGELETLEIGLHPGKLSFAFEFVFQFPQHGLQRSILFIILTFSLPLC
jgi:hypothetical protein